MCLKNRAIYNKYQEFVKVKFACAKFAQCFEEKKKHRTVNKSKLKCVKDVKVKF